VPVLLDMSEIHFVQRKAREYAATEFVGLTSQLAIVVDTLLSRFLGNLFMRLNKPPMPIRMFTNDATALAWLKEF
jgi:hypothetical protein